MMNGNLMLFRNFLCISAFVFSLSCVYASSDQEEWSPSHIRNEDFITFQSNPNFMAALLHLLDMPLVEGQALRRLDQALRMWHPENLHDVSLRRRAEEMGGVEVPFRLLHLARQQILTITERQWAYLYPRFVKMLRKRYEARELSKQQQEEPSIEDHEATKSPAEEEGNVFDQDPEFLEKIKTLLEKKLKAMAEEEVKRKQETLRQRIRRNKEIRILKESKEFKEQLELERLKQKNEDEKSLAAAASRNDIETVQNLVERGVQIDNPYSPLVAGLHLPNLVAYFLKRNADPNQRNHAGDTALCLVITWERYEIASLLIAAGANVNLSCQRGSPLSLVKKNAIAPNEMMRTLMHKGARLGGFEDLYNALYLDDLYLLRLLIEEEGLSIPTDLLHFAAKYKSTACVPYLLERGLDANQLYRNDTPLYTAITNHADGVFDRLIDRTNSYGSVEMYYAVMWSNLHAVQGLVQRGVSVNTPVGHTEESPLHAVSDPEIARYLISCGANVFAKNRDGQTPLEVAHSLLSREAMIPILEEAERAATLNWTVGIVKTSVVFLVWKLSGK
jgi:ankyrin repeat protein